MYDEALILRIKNETNQCKQSELIGDFYKTNLKLIGVIAKEQSISREDYYDYMQLGYYALLTAIAAFNKESKFPFLSYFRRSFKHEIYKFNLEFHSPMRVKSPWYFKDYKCDYISFEREVQRNDITTFYAYDDAFKQVEDKMLTSTLLKIMQTTLNSMQYYVLVEIFWHNYSKNEVALQLHCSTYQVRYAYTSALKTLRALNSIKCIARDLFGIYD